MYEERCLRTGGPPADAATLLQLSEKVLQLCAAMQNKHDIIREKYWEYVAFNFRVQFDRLMAAAASPADAAADAAVPLVTPV